MADAPAPSMHRTSIGLFTSCAFLLFAACAAPPPAASSPVDTRTTGSTLAAPAEGTQSESKPSDAPAAFCDLVCERARVERRTSDAPADYERANEDANRVLSAMHPDLLACYRQRVSVNPAAHGFITANILIGPDGHVINVATTGGAILGPGTMACIVRRIEKGVFLPPYGGGTMRIQVPFSLRRLAADEET